MSQATLSSPSRGAPWTRLGVAAIVMAVLALFAAGVSPAFAATPTITSLTPDNGSTAGGTAVSVVGTGFTAGTTVTVGGTPATSVVVNNATSLVFTTPARPGIPGDAQVNITVPGEPISAITTFEYTGPAAALPVVTALNPTSGPIAGGTVVTIGGSGFTGATKVVVDGVEVNPTTVSGDTSVVFTTPAHAVGVVDIQVKTPAGTSAANAASKFTYSNQPIVTGITPNGGPVTGGTPVTIVGSGFTGASAVSFGGTIVLASGFTVNSGGTQITVASPPRTAGPVNVTVTTPVGTSAVVAAAVFTYGSGPAVTSLTPTSGNIAGGTLVTITGTGFTGATAVNFGGALATPTVTNDTTLTVTAPAHAAGLVDVLVVTPVGTSANVAGDNFTYTAGPVVTSITPNSGPIAGGTLVTITGTGFTGATSVTFGGTAVTPTVSSSTSITVLSPAKAAGTVDVLVITPLGTSANTAADNFVYGSGPVITSISPNSGAIAGGTVVTITGTGFTGATSVTFDGTSVTPTAVTDTSITVTSPAHAAGTVSIRVITPVGTSADTAADNFTYGATTITYTLYFRWSLIVWNGANGADITARLEGQETPDNPATNNISGQVTAIFRYNNAQQKFEGFFPGSAGIPGANDFTTFTAGQSYWIAIAGPNNVTWTVQAN